MTEFQNDSIFSIHGYQNLGHLHTLLWNKKFQQNGLIFKQLLESKIPLRPLLNLPFHVNCLEYWMILNHLPTYYVIYYSTCSVLCPLQAISVILKRQLTKDAKHFSGKASFKKKKKVCHLKQGVAYKNHSSWAVIWKLLNSMIICW